MFIVGDVVTFKKTEQIFDANQCLLTFKGNLYPDPYYKPNRIWLVMEKVSKGTSDTDEDLYVLCLIAKDPTPVEGIPGVVLAEGSLGIVRDGGVDEEIDDEPEPNRFKFPLATIVAENGLEYWFDYSKTGKARKLKINVSTFPDWKFLANAFKSKWKAPELLKLVGRWKKVFLDES